MLYLLIACSGVPSDMSILISYSKILEIVGDIIRVEVPPGGHDGDTAPRFNDLAVVQGADGRLSLAQVI